MAEDPPAPGEGRRPGAAAGQAAGRPRRSGRGRGSRPRRGHQRPGDHPDRDHRADQGPGSRDRRPALDAHPDAHVFTSLPRAGTLRAARLLAEIGDCRSRFPGPESLQGLAGVAPVTRQSGKHASAGFRWAVNKQLRDAVCDFAGDSRHASPWAAGIYGAARARGKDHPHAVRITARAWLYVIWRCWQNGTAYDPGKHRALQRTLDQQQHPAGDDDSTGTGTGGGR
jgi:transposase